MFNITNSLVNKYLGERSRQQWLDLAGDWVDETAAPFIHEFDGFTIWDDSITGVGTKGRWGNLLVSTIEQEELVYVQPRVGWAGISLAWLAKKYGKKLTLFMPASKSASAHQLVCIERGASPVFVRIAAMPVLNKYAKDYANDRGACFIPFGLDHELVVAAGIKATMQQWGDREPPEAVSTVFSTGVLTRTLQIVWPNARFYGVAVARNLHDGEIGNASVISYHKRFLDDAQYANDYRHLIDSAKNYDLKGIEYATRDRIQGLPRAASTLLWNVAGEVHPENIVPGDVDSQREWGERR